MRTFIAIKITPNTEIIKFYNFIRQTFNYDKIKWVESNNFHITLKFLGETNTEIVEKISNELNIFEKKSSFSIDLKGFGIFANPYKPRVLWIGIDKNENLSNLKKQIENITKKYGFVPDKNFFNPHLTLARPKFIENKKLLQELLKKYENKTFQTCKIDKLFFFQSKLTPKGAIYTPIKIIQLNN
jgi:2'-5' RNA ligase